jgi:cold shock CspA family protein
MSLGTVKWWSDEKGFGFITPNDGGKDLFVHHTGVAGEGFRSLTEGEQVAYVAEQGDKGPKAVDVRHPADEAVDDANAQDLADLLAPGFVDPDGMPLLPTSPLYAEMISQVRSVTVDLLNYLAEHPERIHELTPMQFEELVAELLAQRGYDVELSPGSREFDIRAAKNDDVGSFLYLVECKKWAPDNHVPVSVVRELHGTVSVSGASAGMVATTSTFTRDAHKLQESHLKYRMGLKDFFDIKRWLLEGGRGPQAAAA